MAVANTPRLKKVKIGKHVLEVYTIGCLADATGLANVTLRLWERQLILPKPILKLPGTFRYYTALEITTYASLIGRHYSSGRDTVQLRAMLASASIRCREVLKDLVTAETCPLSVSRLHLSPTLKFSKP